MMDIISGSSARNRSCTLLPLHRITCLAAALAFALATGAHVATASPHTPSSGQLRPVMNCDDDGPGSLRAVIGDAMTQPGDTVDLRGLACGRITISTGEIDIAQTDLSLLGPGPAELAIDAGGHSRIFAHAAGSLSIAGITLSSGSYHAAGDAKGGCVRAADVSFSNVVVRDCRVSSDTGTASGGAIDAATVVLETSRVTGNEAASTSGMAFGGGVSSTDVTAKYSTLNDNAVHPGALDRGEGGAIYARHQAFLARCTIDHNAAPYTSAILAHDRIDLIESTVSGNQAHTGAAILAIVNGERYFANVYGSTIAFNHSETAGYAAINLQGVPPAGVATLYSSIIANNTAGESDEPSDLTVDALLFGTDNLVMTTNGQPTIAPPLITVVDDPMLRDLQDNGGPTRTHALGRGSAAIGAGSNTGSQLYDQRGRGYPRESGASASVDIGAFQFDSIFADVFE
jgi:hypothetical protein